MKKIIAVLMSRDGLTETEAKERLDSFIAEFEQDLENGGSPWDWEENFQSEFGLEPDYFESILFSMC